MNFGQWYVRHGRIDRPTYWLHYFLPLVAVSIVVEIVMAAAGTGSASTAQDGTVSVSPTAIWLPALVFLLLACPSISSQVTRLHDRGHSAWWLLWTLLPFAGGIVLLVQMCLPGEPGENRYGPAPSRNQVADPPYPASQA